PAARAVAVLRARGRRLPVSRMDRPRSRGRIPVRGRLCAAGDGDADVAAAGALSAADRRPGAAGGPGDPAAQSAQGYLLRRLPAAWPVDPTVAADRALPPRLGRADRDPGAGAVACPPVRASGRGALYRNR